MRVVVDMLVVLFSNHARLAGVAQVGVGVNIVVLWLHVHRVHLAHVDLASGGTRVNIRSTGSLGLGFCCFLLLLLLLL